MRNFLRKLHISDGSHARGSWPPPLPSRKFQPSADSSWLDSVPTHPPPPIPVEEAPTTSAPVGVGAEDRQSSAAADRRRRSSKQEEEMEEVEERVIWETSEAEERKRRREEDELEAYHTQLALEMSQWDNNSEEMLGIGDWPSPAEVLAVSYWHYGNLGYDDKVADGFYDLVYVGHGQAASDAIPSVAEL
ncbi:unnamed protein product [Urochloa humidicola]